MNASPKKFIVLTTINRPTEAAKRFRGWPGWEVVVVGDRKTPADWACEGVRYFGLEEQYDAFGALARAIPENTYTRKMLGYVYAIRQGATAIFESDDDNLPYPHAAPAIDEFLTAPSRTVADRQASTTGWFNIYRWFGVPGAWPRGFPLEHIKQNPAAEHAGKDALPWSVLQCLADDDPDVDAIFRMVDGRPCKFTVGRSLTLDRGTYAPVNSQATLWTAPTFPLLYLPLGVPDRVTDILRGYIATAAIWQMGHTVGYASPTVYQERNAHNLHKDFLQEALLYANAAAWGEQLKRIQAAQPAAFYRAALTALESPGVFSRANIPIYDLFLAAIAAPLAAEAPRLAGAELVSKPAASQ